MSSAESMLLKESLDGLLVLKAVGGQVDLIWNKLPADYLAFTKEPSRGGRPLFVFIVAMDTTH